MGVIHLIYTNRSQQGLDSGEKKENGKVVLK
jgi:hypothetical protein